MGKILTSYEDRHIKAVEREISVVKMLIEHNRKCNEYYTKELDMSESYLKGLEQNLKCHLEGLEN